LYAVVVVTFTTVTRSPALKVLAAVYVTTVPEPLTAVTVATYTPPHIATPFSLRTKVELIDVATAVAPVTAVPMAEFVTVKDVVFALAITTFVKLNAVVLNPVMLTISP
jgi:hypothetical protein